MIITLSSGIISSILRSPPAYSMVERLPSPYFSFTSSNSSLITCILRSLRAKMSLRSLMVSIISSYSALNLSCSSPVSCRNRISTIALACSSDSSNLSINFCRASSALLEERISAITSSILSDAMINPSRMCARSSAFFNSNSVRRTTTSCLCSTK